jgi:hypothetical protein
VSASPSPLRAQAEAVRVLYASTDPAALVSVSAGTLLGLAAAVLEDPVPTAAAVPPADPTVHQLAERYGLSANRILDLIAAGEFGEPHGEGGPYKDGRAWRCPWPAVLARDARVRERDARTRPAGAPRVPRSVVARGGDGLSLSESRRARKHAGRAAAG